MAEDFLFFGEIEERIKVLASNVEILRLALEKKIGTNVNDYLNEGVENEGRPRTTKERIKEE